MSFYRGMAGRYRPFYFTVPVSAKETLKVYSICIYWWITIVLPIVNVGRHF